ncbi:hypothetical protein ALC62_09712 [Cyphomyrmex costatus]|uniref:Uncharacterized protein n=1 Tax=Cyphomyrmex costatus TaxID=456900 RepID=A0A151IF61_9HYME|nr:hypothetical protein ALC62_09712 [Cyphomyrmex costatus]
MLLIRSSWIENAPMALQVDTACAVVSMTLRGCRVSVATLSYRTACQASLSSYTHAPLHLTSINKSDSVESAPLLEIFRIFHSTDNTLIFANAVSNCILYLLKHVRNIDDNEDQSDETENINNTESRRLYIEKV